MLLNTTVCSHLYELMDLFLSQNDRKNSQQITSDVTKTNSL